MKLGFIGLGKMGGNMVHRIHRDSDHEVVAFDFSADAVKEAEGHGAAGAGSLEELVGQLEAPRAVWIMVPSGDPTTETVNKLGELLDAGDMIIDGGNSRWTDDKARGEALAPCPSAALTASLEKSNATTWWSESRWMRWTMFPPIFPSPTKPSCIRGSPSRPARP